MIAMYTKETDIVKEKRILNRIQQPFGEEHYIQKARTKMN